MLDNILRKQKKLLMKDINKDKGLEEPAIFPLQLNKNYKQNLKYKSQLIKENLYYDYSLVYFKQFLYYL